MFNIGPEEILLILVIALVFLGPQRLPEVARQIGKGLREFRNLTGSARDELMKNVSLDADETVPSQELKPIEPGETSSNGSSKPKKKKKPKEKVEDASSGAATEADAVPSSSEASAQAEPAGVGASEQTEAPGAAEAAAHPGNQDAGPAEPASPEPSRAEADVDPAEQSR